MSLASLADFHSFMTNSSAQLQRHVELLAAETMWTYRGAKQSNSEPAAWAALALSQWDAVEAARKPALWLAGLQQTDGSVGISAAEREPRWPTALAILAWSTVDGWAEVPQFRDHIDNAVAWALANHGKPAPKSPEVGHDTTLLGWSWAADTHSWLEPTAMFVLALKAVGKGQHPRCREGVLLLHDRLLPDGGANYGNTFVFGQELVPHVQPTGLAMLALAGEEDADGRIAKSVDYLTKKATGELATDSLSYALMGLAAHNRSPTEAPTWIERRLDRSAEESASPLSVYDRALLLAAAKRPSWKTSGSLPASGRGPKGSRASPT